jgi:hypothetical protein
VIDRIAYGAVADFFSLHVFGFSGTCSISPTPPLLPVAGLLYESLFRGQKGRKTF